MHTPFCEQLCYFCTCSKVITKNYDTVKDYLYNYMFKEIDLLFNFLDEKKIKLNVKEIYFVLKKNFSLNLYASVPCS